MNIKRKYTFLLVMTSLLVASLACNLPGIKRPENITPEPLPVTTEAAEQLQEDIEEAAEALLEGKPFSLSITEAQATSMANQELQSMGESGVQNLQIYLRDGQIQVFGDVNRDGLVLPVSFAARVYAAQGSLAYEIVDASIGPFPIPQGLIDDLEAQLDRIILAQLSPTTSNVVIETINIQNGVMTITGHAR